MTSNVLHHINDLKDAWRRQDFNLTSKQQTEYDILISSRRESVRGFYATGRVFKGSKASADKIRDEEQKAKPVLDDLDD